MPRWAYAIAIMSAILLVFFWLSIDPKSATIRGTVENSETGKPVADAKVIATLWYDKSFGKSHPHKFGTKTTAEGRFRFSVKPGFGISRIDIGACAPNGHVLANHDFEGDSIELSLPPAREWMKGLSYYEYENFSGGWSGETTWVRNEAADESGEEKRQGAR